MKVKDCMSRNVVSVGAQEPVSVAARLMSRYNLGFLPVQGENGRLCGVLTDRDVVLRCVAAGKPAEQMRVMRGHVRRRFVRRGRGGRGKGRAPHVPRAAAQTAGHAEWKADRHDLRCGFCAARQFWHGNSAVHGSHLQPGRASGLKMRAAYAARTKINIPLPDWPVFPAAPGFPAAS